MAPRLGGIKQKKLIIHRSASLLFLLFYSPKPQDQVRILIYRKWSIPCSNIVLVAIQDDGSVYISPALHALKRLGAVAPILKDFRDSFALIGYAQPSKPSWIAQERQKRYEGPSEIFLRIPLMQSRQPRKNLLMFGLYSNGSDGNRSSRGIAPLCLLTGCFELPLFRTIFLFP